jgi:hypothetical protein
MKGWRLVAGALLIASGCSGSSAEITGGDDGGGDDGGVDGTTMGQEGGAADSASPDVVTAAVCPPYSGASTYCSALEEYCKRCPATFQPCALENLAQCGAFASVLSADFAQATAECQPAAACDTDGAATEACIAQKLQGAAPTAEQQKLASDMCAVCAPTSSSCPADFYKGTARVLFFVSDPLIGQVDQHCLTQLSADAGAFKCLQEFLTCAGVVLAPITPKDACKDGG